MKIGAFRRQVARTLSAKPVKTAMRTATKNSTRVLVAQSTVGLKTHTGQLIRALSQYLLGLPTTQEMKDAASVSMGDVGYNLTALARLLKVKLPSSTKKLKLVGTRSAALLQLDSLATDLLTQVGQGVFTQPKMKTVTKIVTLPAKGGAKEERQVAAVDVEAEAAAETTRQDQMRALLNGAIDVYWRLNFDMFGAPPAQVLADKFTRMQTEFPATVWAGAPAKAPVKAQIKPAVKATKKAKPEAVTA